MQNQYLQLADKHPGEGISLQEKADGYRRLSKEDELSILSSEFEEFVEKRFGEQHQEESVKAAGEYMSLSR